MKKTITTTLRALLCSLSLLFALPLAAQTTGTIPIGSGTAASAQSLPVYTYYYFTYSQQIVKASEYADGYGGAGPITKIRYYLSTAQTPLANWNNWTVYMGHTTKSSFATSNDWEPLSNLQQVFSGTVTQVAGQWMEITFNTPFIYDGSSNIIVAVDENSNGYTSSLTSTYYGSYTGGANTGMYYASDDNNPNPASPPAGIRTATLPRLQFEGTFATCFKPTGVQVTSFDATTATIGWTAPATAPQQGYEYVVSTTNTPPAASAGGTPVAGTSVTVPVSASTTYYFWVRGVCSGTDKSVWTPAYTFTTPCAPVNVPYIENFESVTVPALPACTSIFNAGTGNNWETNSPNNYGFTTKALRYSYNINNAANVWFFTRGVNLTAGTSYRISYKYGNSGNTTYVEKLKVSYGTAPTVAGMATQLANHSNINSNAAVTTYVDFTPAATGVYYFGFHAYSDANKDRLYVDDIKVDVTPTCFPPSGLTAIAADAETVDISWTESTSAPANGYEYYFSTTNTAPTAATEGTEVPTGITASFTALPNTTYYVWVRSICDDSDISEWTQAVSVTTPCQAFDAPFLEEFSTGIKPSCWTNSSSNPVANGLWKFTDTVDYAVGNTRPNGTFAWADGSTPTNINDVTLTTPEINLATLSVPMLVFEFFSNNTGTDLNNQLRVDIYNGTTWTNIFSNNTSLAQWRTAEVSLADYAGMTVKIRFVFDKTFAAPDNAFYNDILLDNVQVIEAPTCIKPAALTAVAASATSIDISWPAVTPAPSGGYEYYVTTDGAEVPDAFTDGTDVPSGTSATYTADENTVYFVWVRSKCDGNDVSEWFGPVSVSTPCSAVDVPYLENFESVTPPALPDCTKAVKTGLGNIWTTSAVNAGGFNSNVLRYNYTYSGAANTWFFTQGINLTAGTSYRITYKYGANSGTYIEKMKVAYGTDSTVAAMTTVLADYTSITGTTYNTAAIDFTPSATGVYYFGFHAYSALGQNVLYVDDIEVNLSPTCIAPVNVQVQPQSSSAFAISWQAPAVVPANGYEYYVATDATDVPDANTDGVDVPTGTSATYTTATGNTTYYVYVRSKCEGTDVSAWTQMKSVTTPCDPVNVPYVEDFESVTVPALPVCTLNQNLGTGNNWTTNSPNSYGFTTKALRYNYSSSNAANTWFITKGVNLTAGVTYKISYRYGNSGNTTYVEKLKVAYGTAQNAAAMNTQLANHSNINSNTAVSTFVEFTPAATGVYYFGFHAYSDANKDKLYVDDIVVDTAAGTDSHNMNQFTYYPNPVIDVLNLSFTSDITSVEVYNMLGQRVLRKEVNSTQVVIDMLQLPDGNYVVNVATADAVKTIKVVKKQQ